MNFQLVSMSCLYSYKAIFQILSLLLKTLELQWVVALESPLYKLKCWFCYVDERSLCGPTYTDVRYTSIIRKNCRDIRKISIFMSATPFHIFGRQQGSSMPLVILLLCYQFRYKLRDNLVLITVVILFLISFQLLSQKACTVHRSCFTSGFVEKSSYRAFSSSKSLLQSQAKRQISHFAF